MNKIMSNLHTVYGSNQSPWTPEFWRGYCETSSDVDSQRKYRQSREPLLALKHLQLGPGDIVLEAGCGYARITSHLLQAGADVVGCDISPSMINFYKQHFHYNRPFECIQADISNLPFHNNSFDKVLCNGVLMHVDDYKKAISELCRVLSIGGRLVISMNSSFCPLIQIHLLQKRLRKHWRRLIRKPKLDDRIKYEVYAPIDVVRFLCEENINILKVEADTLFCGDLRLPIIKLPVLPTFGLPVYRALDLLLTDKFPFFYFGWEVWFVGIKEK